MDRDERKKKPEIGNEREEQRLLKGIGEWCVSRMRVSEGGVGIPAVKDSHGVAAIPLRYPALSLRSKLVQRTSGAKWRLWTAGLDLGAAIGL
jgi:hypothetical protein